MEKKESAIDSFLKRAKLVTSLWAALLIVLGIFLLINPDVVLIVVCRLIGLALLIYGVVLIISSIMAGSPKERQQAGFFAVSSMVFGIVLVAIGIFIFIRPGTIVGFVSILFAIILFTYGVHDIIEMQYLFRYQDVRWWISLIGAIVTIALGLIILLNPFGSAAVLMQITGIGLIFTGVSGILINGRSSRYAKKFEKEMRESENTDASGNEIIDGQAVIEDIPDTEEKTGTAEGQDSTKEGQ